MLVLVAGSAWAQEVVFFRICGAPVQLAGLSEAGVLAWEGAASDSTLCVQRAHGLGDWQNYAEVLTTGPVQRLQVHDPEKPAGMVFIPRGVFWMGATTNAGHEGFAQELPQHRTEVGAFLLDTTEVTKGLWDEVVAWAVENGYALSGAQATGKEADHPVVQVSWWEAVIWCNARSERAGLVPSYTCEGQVIRSETTGVVNCDWTASGFRLPTEAEWEKAARGGTAGHRFPWLSDDEITHERANYFSFCGCTYDTSVTRAYHPASYVGSSPYTRPVASFPANAYGLHDMAGNVREWCWDWFSANAYATASEKNSTGPAEGVNRCLRGGGWSSGADGLRVAVRGSAAPGARSSSVGFRCARTSQPAPE